MRALAIAIVVCTAAHAARADDKVDPSAQTKADVFFEKGQADYQAGKFQAAIELFTDAYELVHDPVYLFNIAQSYRKVADCVAATEYYNKYLAEAPNAENRTKVQGWIREMSPCVEERRAEAEKAHKLDELEKEKRVEAERARQLQLQRAAARGQTVDHGKTLRIAGLATAGAGAIGVGLGVAFSIRGTNLKNQVATDCAMSCVWDQEKSLDAQGKHANTIAAVSYAVGGAALLAGTGLYIWGRVRIESVAIAPTAGGATAMAGLRF